MPRRVPAAGVVLLAALLAGCTSLAFEAPAPGGAPAPGATAPEQVPQAGELRVLPRIAQRSPQAAPADRAATVVTAGFRRALAYREVRLERRQGESWEPLRTGTLDAKGRVSFRVGGGDPTTPYQVVVLDEDSSPQLRSPAATGEFWRMEFSDEFDGDALDESVWTHRQVGLRHGSRLRSESSPEAVRVDGGRVLLSVHEIPGEPGYFYNGHISTAESRVFTHGLLAARIRFPRGQGQHGSFWSQTTGFRELLGREFLSGAEIDVVEYFGDGRPDGGLAHFVYGRRPDGSQEKIGGVIRDAARAIPDHDDWWRGYHVFSVEWTPEEYVFRVDGHETYRTDQAVSLEPQYLILSLLTSDWELGRLDTDTLPTSMEVDWVRVWQER